MPSFRVGVVTEVLLTRAGLQRMRVEVDGVDALAYALTDVVGLIAQGDRVVLNTTAVELKLGTGGSHVVHWNLSVDEVVRPGSGHIMKARYTSVQVDVGAAEEHHSQELSGVHSIDSMPVVVAVLHSQVAGIVAAVRATAATVRIAYVMSDGAALPIAISDLVTDLRDVGWIDSTITAGNAFGGDYEAVNVWSALTVARHIAHADLVVVAPGPGVVGTGTRFGTTSVDMGGQLDAAGALGGIAVATVRASDADVRLRHQGLSHHCITALGLVAQRRCTVALPMNAASSTLRAECGAAGIAARHDIVDVAIPDIIDMFQQAHISVASMGRPAAQDRLLFECAAASGAWAAQHVL